MKKLMVISLAGMLMLLAACSDDDSESKTTSETSGDQTVSEKPDESEAVNDSADDQANDTERDDDETQADTDDQSDDDSEAGETASESQLKDFPEYDTLTDEFDVDSFKSEIATDNPDKRVILYADDSGEKHYKSIFIKHNNRLKIISLDKQGQIFNGQLD